MSSPCQKCGGVGISFCSDCDIYNGKYMNSTLEDIKTEILEKCHGLATNIDEPYDEHEIVFADEVISIIDSHIH